MPNGWGGYYPFGKVGWRSSKGPECREPRRLWIKTRSNLLCVRNWLLWWTIVDSVSIFGQDWQHSIKSWEPRREASRGHTRRKAHRVLRRAFCPLLRQHEEREIALRLECGVFVGSGGVLGFGVLGVQDGNLSDQSSKSHHLLAHLAMRLTDRTENLATEALGYILNNSAAARANEVGELASEGDLRQLHAFCKREDIDAFPPLRSVELGPDVSRRLRNLRKLVDEATELARARGFVDTTGLKVTPQTYGYGRYIRLGSAESGWAEAWFGVNYYRWGVDAETPIWLHFVESKDSPHMSLEEVDGKLQRRRFYIPLPTGVEYESVRDEVVKNLRWLAEGLC